MHPSTQVKKHVPSEGYDIAHRLTFPLFDPLTEEEQAALSLGQDAFIKKFPETLVFPDPFLTPQPIPSWGKIADLRMVCGSEPLDKKTAQILGDRIQQKWGVTVPVISDQSSEAALAAPFPKLHVGATKTNVRVLEIARKYGVGLFSTEFPGEGGWGLTTYGELEPGFHANYVLVCDATTQENAWEFTLDHLADADGNLRWVHRVDSPKIAHPDYATWVRNLGSPATRRYACMTRWIEEGGKQPYREVFVEFFNQKYSLPKGLPYNATFLDVGLFAVRHYQDTGDEEVLSVFRETLYGFWNYLHLPDPEIYISDLDFRIGLLCSYWNWVKPHPLFSNEERFQFDQLFLAAMRMVRDYYRNNWKQRGDIPHNHKTFKMRSLILGWLYFRNRGVGDSATWKEEADALFESVPPDQSKFGENASLYECFVLEHTLTWLEITRRPIPEALKNSLAAYAQREWAMRDNFLYRVDYGDSDPTTEWGRTTEVSPWLDGDSKDQTEIRNLENSTYDLFTREGFPLSGFPNLTTAEKGRTLQDKPGWTRCPLDSHFAQRFALTGSEDEQFDKLVWRSRWDAHAGYFALEGVGSGNGEKKISHAHHEANGVLRLNLGGRIWLIRSGYGKKPQQGITDAGKLFAMRQTGPEEHNMLIMRNAETDKPELPPANALLKAYGDAPLPFSVTEVASYADALWRRITIILPDAGILIADQVVAQERELQAVPELQWNALGELCPQENGAVLAQSGEKLIWSHFGTTLTQWKESEIYIWKYLVESGAYPHTKAPPVYCIQKSAQSDSQRSILFLNGFWLDEAVQDVLWNGQELLWVSRSPLPTSPQSAYQSSWGEIEVDRQEVRVKFSSLDT